MSLHNKMMSTEYENCADLMPFPFLWFHYPSCFVSGGSGGVALIISSGREIRTNSD
ncbi:hypothetical protein BO83DRAFT_376182 [Aspergillus eucalypticola CBS 122712]|uniref:Uncharacterized protein n=1 Tax=Aspergillus eucalypticola (strain CBS 122712 / IBT 29274) TaxID=1448314 RepID=A0A317W040_ASPEC|nr:uncharacterized protein BO83DRAFT_376182 [Aspergillus eucalypticola CBS 122712]PWY78612.1 hypothetical protein BO83DRAFT_376182 [Aspergillus eucalypticola CBS 122712]